MPKKYKITQPEKCLSCDKSSDCLFLKQMNQKPFDVSGVLLDCKAFYTVFCELEERCTIPFGDSEKMEKYHAGSDEGKRLFLTPAMVTNGALAVELALKALAQRETGMFDCVHSIDKLFYALPEEHKVILSDIIKTKAHQSDVTLKKNLEIIGNFFVDWRYFFQFESIGYSGFLLDFIHIVCDYAIAIVENSAVDGENL